PDPARATELANAFAQEFVQRNIDLGSEAVRQTVADLQKQIEPIRKQIEEAEHNRFGIAEHEQLYVPESEKDINAKTLADFQADLTRTQLTLNETVGVIGALDDLRKSGGDPLTIRQISENPAIRSLVEQRNSVSKEIEGLKVKYRPGAPELTSSESQLA